MHRRLLPLLLPLGLAAPAAAAPDQVREGAVALQARRAGKILPLPEIERRVLPTMKGYEYLGFDLDFGTSVYTLKFMRDGVVVWVDVDGRSGQIIGRTGN